MPPERPICFVIMPFKETTKEHTEDYWNKHFESFLKPLIEEVGNLEARRSEPLRGNIQTQIVTDLISSPVVVADLTDHNPNVFWELGVRQSFKHGTITVAEEGTELPFDVRTKGTLFYPKADRFEQEEFCRKFKKALRDSLEHPKTPDSVVLESISGRGSLFELFRQDETIRRLDALLSECSWNSAVLDKIANRIDKNRKNPKNRKFTAARLRMSSIELLVANRYIAKPRRFFVQAEGYLSVVDSMNEGLNRWKDSPVSTEKWLLRVVGRFRKMLKEFSTEVEDSREEIRRQV